MPLNGLPPDARPREKLLARGAGALSDAELLHASADDIKRVKGLGPAKRAELLAVLELARRAMAQQLREQAVFADPGTIKHYLQLHLAVRAYEVFAVVFLDVQNRLLALEERFRRNLTQLSVTLLRKYFGWFRYFTAAQSESQLWSRTTTLPTRRVPNCAGADAAGARAPITRAATFRNRRLSRIYFSMDVEIALA